MYRTFLIVVFVAAFEGSNAQLVPLHSGLVTMVLRSIDIVNAGSFASDAVKSLADIAVDLIRHSAEEKDCAKEISNEVEIMRDSYLQNYDECIFNNLKNVENLLYMLYAQHTFHNEVDSELAECREDPLIPCLQKHLTDISNATDSILSLLGQVGYAIVDLLHTIEVCSINATLFTGYNIIQAVHEANCCEDPSINDLPETA